MFVNILRLETINLSVKALLLMSTAEPMVGK